MPTSLTPLSARLPQPHPPPTNRRQGHSRELLNFGPAGTRTGLKNAALHEGIISGAVALGGFQQVLQCSVGHPSLRLTLFLVPAIVIIRRPRELLSDLMKSC
jgi:hypothetical protein